MSKFSPFVYAVLIENCNQVITKSYTFFTESEAREYCRTMPEFGDAVAFVEEIPCTGFDQDGNRVFEKIIGEFFFNIHIGSVVYLSDLDKKQESKEEKTNLPLKNLLHKAFHAGHELALIEKWNSDVCSSVKDIVHEISFEEWYASLNIKIEASENGVVKYTRNIPID